MQSKLTAWKGELLSFQDILVLIRSVLSSVSLCTMAIYKCHASVLCDQDLWEHHKKFLWSSDSEVTKYKTLAWKKVCTPFCEEGLGIRRLETVNKALLMKMMWKIIKSQEEWPLFFLAKFTDKHGQWNTNWKQSTVCSGLRWAWNSL